MFESGLLSIWRKADSGVANLSTYQYLVQYLGKITLVLISLLLSNLT